MLHSIQRHFTYYLTKLALSIGSALPAILMRNTSYRLLTMTGYRKAVIEQNLMASFPDRLPTEISAMRKKFYYNLAGVIASQAKGASGQNITYTNLESLLDLLQHHQGAILLGSHYGCWEAVGKGITSHLTSYAQYVAYKKIKNPLIDQLVKKRRSDTPATPIDMRSLYKQIVENKKRNIPAAYYLIADQYPSSLQNILEIPFLQQQTRFINGPEKMASKLRLPVVFLDTTISEDITSATVSLKVVYNPADPQSKENDITKMYASLLESQIQRKPEHWLWSHRRWKNIR